MQISRLLRKSVLAGLTVSALGLLSGCSVVNHHNANKRAHLNGTSCKIIYASPHGHRKSIKTTHGLKRLSRMRTRSLNVFRARLLADINRGRRQYGRKPLKVTSGMQRAANYRTPRVMHSYLHLKQGLKYRSKRGNPYDNWVHGNYNHTSGYDYLLKHNYGFSCEGANATNWSKGYSDFNRYPDGVAFKYNNNMIRGVADNVYDEYMNHDDTIGNANGHRKNILSKHYKYIGIGVAYNAKRNLGIDNEQFAG